MALHRLGTGRITHGFMALLKLTTMNIFTHKIINLCPATSHDPNLCVALLGEESSAQLAVPPIIESHYDDADGESKDLNMPVFHHIDLARKTFLLEPCEDRQQLHARIVKAIEEMNIPLHRIPTVLNSFAQSIMTLLRK